MKGGQTLTSKSKLPRRRMEELLEAAELGSVPHIIQLVDVFPGGIGFVKRALSIVLRQLQRGVGIRVFEVSWNIKRVEDESQLAIVRGSFAAFEDLLEYMEKTNQDEATQLLEVFHRNDNMAGFTGTLKRCADFSSANAPGFTTVNSLYHLVGANYAHRLLNVGLSFFEAEPEQRSLSAFVEHILTSWLLGVGDSSMSRYPSLSLSDFNLISMGTRALWKTYNEDSTRVILTKLLYSLNESALKRLSQTFTHYCSLWLVAYKPSLDRDPKTADCRPLLAIITIAHKLAAHVHPFRHALARSGFPGWSLDFGWRIRQVPSISKFGGSMAADIACVVYPAWTTRAWEASRVIPQLLDCSLLDIIADDALMTREKDLRRWSGQDPLLQLWRASHHPDVCKALLAAQSRLPMDKIAEHGDTANRFAVLRSALNFYAIPGDSRSDQYATFTCASVQHDLIGIKPIPKVYQCSQCRTVAYCSPACQKQDWKALHREECLRNRVHRIDCELRAFWLSYRNRVRYLDALQPIMCQALSQLDRIPPESRTPSDRTHKPIWLACARDIPMEIRPCVDADDFLRMTGESLARCPSFVNDRFRAIVGQYEGNIDVQMVGCAWKIGDVWISALGVFDMRSCVKGEDGRERYAVLNGHVNVCRLSLVYIV